MEEEYNENGGSQKSRQELNVAGHYPAQKNHVLLAFAFAFVHTDPSSHYLYGPLMICIH